MKKSLLGFTLASLLFSAGSAMAAEYKIDKEGQHAFINFRISKGGRHLKQAKNADGLAISRGDEVTAEQDAEQQQIKGDMCNNRADAGQSRVACE